MGDPPGDRGGERLPVLEAAPELASALDTRGVAVLVAPPGTGKTTGVPPLLLQRGWAGGRIILVVPRRMAARAAARRMAAMEGGSVGDRFGYTVRHDRRSGPGTRVEAVTPGVLLRRIQRDPSLDGASAVLLDEFHERSVDLDLLLALLGDVRSALRDDLRLLVMSATLETDAIADVLGARVPGGEIEPAPVVRVESPLYPIQTHHRPGSAHDRLDDRVTEVVTEALGDTEGDILVFLPGRGEISSTARALRRRVGASVELCELHGSLPPRHQDEILAPPHRTGKKRRVILSTSIAETSVTVPGVRVVVDAGRRRTQEVDPRTGLPALVTRGVSLAGADQRRGRCGREGPGVCYRMWSVAEEEIRRRVDPPEIAVADLSPLLLQTLDWGAEPGDLTWLDPPPAAGLVRARELLADLGALDGRRLGPVGHRLAGLGFHPRLGAIACAGEDLGAPGVAAEVVAVIDADGAGTAEVAEGVRALQRGEAPAAVTEAHRQWKRRLGSAGGGTDVDLDRLVGELVLAGYADRLARRRQGRSGVYHLRGGGEVELKRSAVHIGDSEWIVAVTLDARTGSGRPGVLHLGAGVHPDDIESLLEQADRAGLIETTTDVEWNPGNGAVSSTTTLRLGSIVTDVSRSRSPHPDAVAEAVAEVVRRDGPTVLAGWDGLEEFRNRIAFLGATGVPRPSDREAGWPDLSAAHLAATSQDWVGAVVAQGMAGGRFDPSATALRNVLAAGLTWDDRSALDEEAPTHWMPPQGNAKRLRYGTVEGDPTAVLLACRLQDLLGIDIHPAIGRRHSPLTVELLSPAGRPVQRTLDLPGFWRGSYGQVRSEMRGRYAKHRWPEHPWES